MITCSFHGVLLEMLSHLKIAYNQTFAYSHLYFSVMRQKTLVYIDHRKCIFWKRTTSHHKHHSSSPSIIIKIWALPKECTIVIKFWLPTNVTVATRTSYTIKVTTEHHEQHGYHNTNMVNTQHPEQYEHHHASWSTQSIQSNMNIILHHGQHTTFWVTWIS